MGFRSLRSAADVVNEITDSEMVGTSWVTPAYSAVGNMATLPQPADPTLIVGNPDDIASDCENRREMPGFGAQSEGLASHRSFLLTVAALVSPAVSNTGPCSEDKTPQQRSAAIVNAPEQEHEGTRNMVLECEQVIR